MMSACPGVLHFVVELGVYWSKEQVLSVAKYRSARLEGGAYFKDLKNLPQFFCKPSPD